MINYILSLFKSKTVVSPVRTSRWERVKLSKLKPGDVVAHARYGDSIVQLVQIHKRKGRATSSQEVKVQLKTKTTRYADGWFTQTVSGSMDTTINKKFTEAV